MKYVFATFFVLLLALSAVAWYAKPTDVVDGRKVIVRATDDNPRRRAQVELFNELHPDYQLVIDANNSSLDKVVVQSVGGRGPDLFDSFQSNLPLLAEAGLLEDVTDALAARGITLDRIWPIARSAITLEGRIYGIPMNVGGGAIFYHKDMFREAGVPFPPSSGWNWDDFVETAKKMTVTDANGRITRYGVMDIGWYDCVLTGGGRMLTPDGRTCVIDSSACIDAIQKWVDLQVKHRVMPSRFDTESMGTQGGWGSGAITLFQERRAAMANGGRWWLCTMRDVKDANGSFPFELGVAEKPLIRVRRFGGGARVVYVNALSPNRDRAVEFLAYLMSDAYSDKLNRDADNMPAAISAATRPSYSYEAHPGRDGGGDPVWRNQMMYMVCGESSPYITAKEVSDPIELQLDMVIMGRKSVADALRAAARDVNDRIKFHVSRNPALRKKYEDGDMRPVLNNFEDPPQSVSQTGEGR